jgi:hypothetical protein
MFGIAAFILAQSQQPDFVQAIQRAPILAIHANLDGKDQIFGIDTGSFDFIFKPTAGSDATAKTAQINLGFLSPTAVEAKLANFPAPASGIIGLNYLHEKAMGIDAQSQTMSFWNKGNLTPDQITFFFSHSPDPATRTWSSSTAISYSVVELEDAGDGHFVVDATVNGAPAKFGLDTDSAISAIDGSVLGSTGFLSLKESNFGGLQQNWPVRVGIIDSLSFGTQDLRALPIAAAPNGSLKPALGLLGFDLLENRRTLIDFPAHKLYLGDPTSTPTGRETLLPYGIRLAPFIGGKQWIGVVPDSIAAKAGLHSGDELISVDGQPVAAQNAPKTGSSLPFDYKKSGLPKSLRLIAQSTSTKPVNYVLTLPTE